MDNGHSLNNQQFSTVDRDNDQWVNIILYAHVVYNRKTYYLITFHGCTRKFETFSILHLTFHVTIFSDFHFVYNRFRFHCSDFVVLMSRRTHPLSKQKCSS